MGPCGKPTNQALRAKFTRILTAIDTLERLAEADAFRSIGLDRRQALWQVRGLANSVLPLFAAVDVGRRPRPELVEVPALLVRMRDGGEVVEDYRSVGLSLRSHPVAFLRATLQTQGMVTCAGLAHARDGRRVVVPGIVLVRQKPGSAKGMMFITIEDETGVANLILWPDRYARQRRLVLSAGMIACHGRVQREGAVIHVITDRLEDLSDLLRSVGERDRSGLGSHTACVVNVPNARPSDIKVPTRDFR